MQFCDCVARVYQRTRLPREAPWIAGNVHNFGRCQSLQLRKCGLADAGTRRVDHDQIRTRAVGWQRHANRAEMRGSRLPCGALPSHQLCQIGPSRLANFDRTRHRVNRWGKCKGEEAGTGGTNP